ncbi:MAG: ABC transporter permease [Kiritimatiellae bacterium]|nr:ABC transporter permease [Kiritimatiellia bacterium]
MNVVMIFKVAILAILRNKTRSLLTCIGIIVGIAAVISVLAIGKGASTMMVKEISSMGNNLMMIWPDWNRKGQVRSGMGAGQTMTAGDAEAIQRELGHLVAAVSPTVNVSSQLIRENRNWSTRVSGVSYEMPEIRNWSVDEGRFFEESEQRGYARVCVIGATVKSHLFDADEDAVGKTIRIGAMPFRVIGVLAAKGANGWGQDQDDTVMAPYTTVGRVLSRSKFRAVNMMNVSLHSMDDAEEAKREITALLRQRHKLADYQDDDFETRDTTEIMNTIGSVSSLMTVLLTAVAAISLLVGGIGIMNIMLVSVTERIKEIGLRMAIGATPANILCQFILEAVVLSTVGGAIGVGVGIATANIIGEVNHWPIMIEFSSALWSFLFSAFVGMFFGFYPAYRASKLNPIDCLRYE